MDDILEVDGIESRRMEREVYRSFYEIIADPWQENVDPDETIDWGGGWRHDPEKRVCGTCWDLFRVVEDMEDFLHPDSHTEMEYPEGVRF